MYWVLKNVFLLPFDPKKSCVSAEKKIVGENNKVTKDEEVMLPPNEDED